MAPISEHHMTHNQVYFQQSLILLSLQMQYCITYNDKYSEFLAVKISANRDD